MLAALAALPAIASAASGPAFYVLKNPKAHCRAGYTKKTVTITVTQHHRKVKRRQLRCVKQGSSPGAAPTFPAGLPTVTVTPTIVPTAAGHTYSTTAGWALHVAAPGVLAGASGHGLTAALVSGPAAGTLALSKDGSFTYTPAPGASGIERFTYRVTDLNSTTSKPATVTIDVAPVATNATYAVASAGTLTVPAGELLSTDIGTGLTPVLVSSTSHGSLSLDAGGAVYDPAGGFAGVDSFTYYVVDADGLTSNVVTVTINVGAVAPSVVSQGFFGAIGNTPLQVGGTRVGGPVLFEGGAGNLLSGDSDPNGGGPLTVTAGTAPTAQGGHAAISSDGSFVYTPPIGFDGPGTDSFSYQVDTTEGTSAMASATIHFSGSRVWYVDSAFGGSTSDGGAATPFTTLSAATAQAAPNDIIFLATGSGTYAGGITLASGVSLAGQGTALTVDTATLLPAGTPPTITNGSGAGISILGTSSVTGVHVANAAGAGVSVFGAGNAIVTLDNMSITGSTGDGVNATGSAPPLGDATLTVTHTAITGSGGAGIADGGSGPQTFVIENDQISGQPGTALALNGFNGDVQGVIVNTTIGDGSTAGSGSSAGNGVDLADATGTFVVEADGNTIGQIATGRAFTVDESGAGEVDLTLGNGNAGTGNTIAGLGAGSGNAFSLTGGAGTTCLAATGNTITSAGAGTFAMSLAAGAGAFSLQGLGVSAVDTFLSGSNTLTGVSAAVHATGTFASATNCRTPNIGGVTS